MFHLRNTNGRSQGILGVFAPVLMAVVIATLASAGCGDSGGKQTPDVVDCVRDPDRINAAERCLADDDCPCGAHCELGRCTSMCLADLMCAEGWLLRNT